MGSGSSQPLRDGEERVSVSDHDLYRRHRSVRCTEAVVNQAAQVDDNISAMVLSDVLQLMKAKPEGFDGASKVIEKASKSIESRLNTMRSGSYVQSFAISRSAIYAYSSATAGSVAAGLYEPKKSAIVNALNAAGKDLFALLEVETDSSDTPGLDYNFGLKKCNVMAAIIPSSEEYDKESGDTEVVETMLWDTLVVVYNADGAFTDPEQSYLKLMATMIETPWNGFTSRIMQEEDHKNQIKLEQMTEHLNSSMDVSTVVLMILDEAKKFIDAEVCSMFLVDHTTQELVAFVFDSKTSETEPITSMLPIDGITPVEAHQVEDAHSGCEVRFPMSGGIAGYVATNNVTLNIPDVYEDERFDQNFDKMTGFKTRNMLAVPIINQGQVIGVAEMINKKKNMQFTKRDERTFKNFIAHTANTLHHAQLYTESKRGVKQRESMLTVAKTIFTETKMKTLIYEIVLQAHQLIKCERCSCFLVDDVRGDLRSLVFDMGKTDVEDILEKKRKEAYLAKRRQGTPTAFSMFREDAMEGELDIKQDVDDEDSYDYQIRIPKDHGIIGHVASTGQAVNISDVYSDPRFNNEMDKATGFKTRNLLVIAIPDNDGKVIGVVSLINKVGSGFDSGDERNLASFAIFCGVGIQSARLHAKMATEQKRTRIALEMIAYRTRAPQSAVDDVLAFPVPENRWEMDTLNFGSYKLDDINKQRCIVQMFDDFGLIDGFKLDRDRLVRFIITVGKNYREVPFHNWDHALSVLHGCYMILKCINQTEEHIVKIEQLALMISCLCHDVDHRGTNNAFLSETGSELESVYGGPSVLEKHHFDHSMSILHNPDNYFLHTLSENDQQLVQDLIQENIMATDLSTHSKQVLPKFKTLTREELENTPVGKHMLRSLLMTSSDLSDTFRSWEVQQVSATRIYDEFFLQGDKEKALGKDPVDMMNRDKENTPKQQIGFIDYVVSPLFNAAVAKFPEMQPMLDNINVNRENWRKAGEARNTVTHYEEGEKVVLPSL